MPEPTDTVADAAAAPSFAGHDVPRDLRAPHVEQYFGPWAIKEDVFRAAFDRIGRTDLRAHVTVQRERAGERETQREGLAPPRADGGGPDAPAQPAPNYLVTESGVAVLTLTGPLMKTVGSLEEGTSTVMFRRKLRSATTNSAIAGIMIVIDSPGGTVAGTFELAEDIAAAAGKKPTHVYIQDLGCSAAYWAASQASVVSTNVMGIVGSIGTFLPVYDFSGWAQKEGIRVEIIKEGQFKGAGTPGTPITEAQVAEWQRTVTALNEQFVAGVARGRGISEEKAKKLNDGRVHVGAAAKSMGLVDHVETFEQSMRRLEGKGKRSGGARAEDATIQPQATDAGGGSAGDTPKAEDAGSPAGSEAETRKETAMSQTQQGAAAAAPATAPAPSEPKAASMAELIAACPGASSDFLVEQAKGGATVQQAKDAYLAFQSEQIKAKDAEIRKLKGSAAEKPAEGSKAEEPAAKKPGVKAVESKPAEAKGAGGADAGDAVAVFEQRVKALVDGGTPRAKASQRVLAEDDQLRQDYIAAKNAK